MTSDHHQNIVIQLFGAFRRVYDQPVKVSVSEDATAHDVKQALGAALQTLNPGFCDLDLLEKSVLADHQKILAPNEPIGICTSLAILPPVCGG